MASQNDYFSTPSNDLPSSKKPLIPKEVEILILIPHALLNPIILFYSLTQMIWMKKVVQYSIQNMIEVSVSGNYSKFGSVRFDTRNPGSFFFFNDKSSLNLSVYSNLPDPSLGFSNNQTGSDILNVLQRFLENTEEIPLCGSQIMILLKRHPKETDTSSLLANLQNHHIFINTVMSYTPILGENHQVMYNLSGLTNGIAGFADNQRMPNEVYFLSDILRYPFQIYSINPICKSKVGREDLPVLRIPQSDSSKTAELFLEVSAQDHGPVDKLRSFSLIVTNTEDYHDEWHLDQGYIEADSTIFYITFFPRQGANYSVNLFVEYSDSIPENVQIRILTYETPVNWLPYTNWN